jgi:DNA gyrase subunit A
MGVKGIQLKKDDFVVGMEVFPPKLEEVKDKRKKVVRDILIVTENGLGKRTALHEYRLQKRGGVGIRAAHITPKTGKIVACKMIDQNLKQVVLTSKKAQVIKLPIKNVPRLGRDTQGVIFMRFNKAGDTVAAVTCLD